MSKPNEGGPAFPRAAAETQNPDAFHPPQDGMSLRDYFAGQALVGIVSRMAPNARLPNDESAAWAYQFADAMLAAREASR